MARRKKPQPKRSYGSGSLYTVTDAAGVEHWYGKWRSNGRQVKRKVGLKRVGGSRHGLTRGQAEAKLRRMMLETEVAARAGEGMTVSEVSDSYIQQAKRRGRKRSTVENVESVVRVHLEPFFGDRMMHTIVPKDVMDLMSVLEDKGLGPKSIRLIIGTLSALSNFAKAPARRWMAVNPCDGVELPAVPERSEIRFLTMEEVDLAIEHARPGMFRRFDRAMFKTAAMTGLRKGELVALRWRDIDWRASRIRVRQNFVRGEFGTPKSRRSTRSVPMAKEVALDLRAIRESSSFRRPDELVFGHPLTGEPLPKANVTRRLKAALKAAGLDSTHRFHDLRHTFGTCCAAQGVPMRTLQEWMGHRDITTTQIYADYAPGAHEAEMIEEAFRRRNGDDEPAGQGDDEADEDDDEGDCVAA